MVRWLSSSGGPKGLSLGANRSLRLSGETCRSYGPPSGRGEQESTSQVHSPGSGTTETPPPPPAEMRSALEGSYATGSKPGPRHHFLVAADPTAELSDDAVALVADVAVPGPPRHDAPEGGVGGLEARSDSGRLPHCEVHRAGRLGGRVP